jgi:hypothetical protein
MSIADDPAPRRRASDVREEALEQRLIILFREELGKTRHGLREEFTVIANDLRLDFANTTRMVQTGNLAQVDEFAQIKAKQSELSSDVADLRRDHREQRDAHDAALRGIRDDFEPRLRQVEANDIAADKTSSLIRWMVGTGLTVCGVVIGAAVFLAQHVH